MEWTTILGLILGFASMAGVLVLGKTGASINTFIDPPALLMVFGGAAAVALIGFPSRQLQSLFAILRKPFLSRLEDPAELIGELVRLAELARKDGLLALEAQGPRDPRPVRRAGDPTGGRRHASGGRRRDHAPRGRSRAARHREAKKIVELVGRCGPAFGMIATLLGLILMLGNLENPDTIGPSMAIALIGTLYGALLANLICIPLGEKLSYLSHEELLARQIVIRGVLAIQAGDNPRVVRQKLDMFLPPRLRERGKVRAPYVQAGYRHAKTARRKTRRCPGVDGLLRRHDHHHHVVLRGHVFHCLWRGGQGQAVAATAGGDRIVAVPLRPQVETVRELEPDARQFAVARRRQGHGQHRPIPAMGDPGGTVRVLKRKKRGSACRDEGDQIAIGGMVYFDKATTELAPDKTARSRRLPTNWPASRSRSNRGHGLESAAAAGQPFPRPLGTQLRPLSPDASFLPR